MRLGRAAGQTDTGRRRRQNEDAFVCEPPLFAVADGMGGAQAGELASRLAAAAIEEGALAIQGEESVAGIVRTANARIFEHSVRDPTAAGMGTTATVAFVDEEAETAAIAHVGDSRAYRYRDGALEQLTTDHSLVGELVRTGRLTEAEAAVHPHRSVITRALGTEADVEVDTRTIDLRAGDLVLICSDGLTAMVRDEEIVRLLEQTGADPHAAAEALVAAANRAGGEDNVTVVLFELVEGEPRRADRATGVRRSRDDGRDGHTATAAADDDDVSRHGAGKGSRWPALAAGRRAARDRRVPRLVELRAMTARNRELFILVLAAIVASGAFATAWFREAAQIDYGWVPWALLLGGVFVVAHLVARMTVPDADPTLLPITALLCALGLTFVYRLDPEGGRKQLVWVAVGVAAFAPSSSGCAGTTACSSGTSTSSASRRSCS